MKVTLKQIKEIKTVDELKNITSIENILSAINDEMKPISVCANTYEELFSIILTLKKQWNVFSSDIYFKNDSVKLIYSLLYARPEVRNKNIGYSEELLNNPNQAKKWYLGLTKKIHPDENPECKEEAQEAMNELKTIYKRIQKCFVDEEGMLMESKNNDELVIREASTYEIKFPDNEFLLKSQMKRIQGAVKKGGISIGNETYISDKELPKLLSTDRKGVTNIMMDAPPEDLRTIGDTEYMSTPQLQKEISKKRQQPRNLIEQEKLGYAMECVDAFSNNPELNKRRAIEAERIAKERASLGKKVIKERQSTVSELSGRPLENEAEVHHKDRVADKPERALDRTNLTVIRGDEHQEYHSSNYLQNEKGYSRFEKDYKKGNDVNS